MQGLIKIDALNLRKRSLIRVQLIKDISVNMFPKNQHFSGRQKQKFDRYTDHLFWSSQQYRMTNLSLLHTFIDSRSNC